MHVHDFGNLFECLNALRYSPNPPPVDEFLLVDSDVRVAPTMSDKDIIAEVQEARGAAADASSQDDSDDADDENNMQIPHVTTSEAVQCLEQLQYYFEQRKGQDSVSTNLSHLEKAVASGEENLKQTTITDFFH